MTPWIFPTSYEMSPLTDGLSAVYMIAMRLNELTPDLIKNGPVPMDDLLKDSVYYPASRTDGRPIAFGK